MVQGDNNNSGSGGSSGSSNDHHHHHTTPSTSSSSSVVHVLLPCRVEKDLSLIDATNADTRTDVVGVIEIIITDHTQTPDDSELSILSG